jgi:hypothetical protein
MMKKPEGRKSCDTVSLIRVSDDLEAAMELRPVGQHDAAAVDDGGFGETTPCLKDNSQHDGSAVDDGGAHETAPFLEDNSTTQV